MWAEQKEEQRRRKLRKIAEFAENNRNSGEIANIISSPSETRKGWVSLRPSMAVNGPLWIDPIPPPPPPPSHDGGGVGCHRAVHTDGCVNAGVLQVVHRQPPLHHGGLLVEDHPGHDDRPCDGRPQEGAGGWGWGKKKNVRGGDPRGNTYLKLGAPRPWGGSPPAWALVWTNSPWSSRLMDPDEVH